MYSFDLEHFLVDDPPQCMLENGLINLAYKSQNNQDYMIDSWLMSCISQDILRQNSGFKTIKEALKDLEQYFLSSSTVRFIQLRKELLKIKIKGSLSISDYMLKLKELKISQNQ